MIIEITKLTRGRVAKHIGVLAAVEEHVGVAEVNTHSVRETFVMPGLRLAITTHIDWLEQHLDPVAVAITVAGRKITIDATTDTVALGIHLDRLGHDHRTIGGNVDVAVKIKDTLIGLRGHAAQQPQDHRKQADHGALLCSVVASKNSPR